MRNSLKEIGLMGGQRMNRNTWKQRERQAAKLFGSERTPLSGGNSKITRSDSLHDELYLECKHRNKSSLWNLYKETKEKAKKENKVPVLSIGLLGANGSLIVIHSDDLKNVLKIMEGK